MSLNQKHLNEFLEIIKNKDIQKEQPAVGHIPRNFAKKVLKDNDPRLLLLNDKKLTRKEVRESCQNKNITIDISLINILAWGGQRRNMFQLTWNTIDNLKPTIEKIKEGKINRKEAFEELSDICNKKKVKGISVSYFTKILFFYSKNEDSPILDQWTAKSVNLLWQNKIINIKNNLPNPKTTSDEYEEYTNVVTELSKKIDKSISDTETFLFSVGGKSSEIRNWRNYVKANSN